MLSARVHKAGRAGTALLLAGSLLPSFASAQTAAWPSAVAGLTAVTVRKVPAEGATGPKRELAALEPAVQKALGLHAVDYPGFVVSYLPAPAAQELATRLGRRVDLGLGRTIQLPWHRFDPEDPQGRLPAGMPAGKPVPGTWIVQFAYPVKVDWLRELGACGLSSVGSLANRAFLVRGSASALERCSVARYVGWVGPYLTSDRLSPAFLAETGVRTYELQYASEAVAEARSRTLPPGMSPALGSVAPGASVPVVSTVEGLRALIESDPDLLSVVSSGSAGPSDERQGAIVAGLHNGTSVPLPKVTAYRDWLGTRGLLNPPVPPVIAFFDTGFDDGTPPSSAVDHHPDLEVPERLVGQGQFPPEATPNYSDKHGHGTMVAGILAGDGRIRVGVPDVGGTGAADAAGYFYGSGIAPDAKLVLAKMFSGTSSTFLDLARQQDAFNFSRLDGAGQEWATIANHSWNEFNAPPGGWVQPVAEYNARGQFFDARVLDASIAAPNNQAMTVVFSSSNFGTSSPTGPIRFDSVSSPATAKNVLSVGATESYRPAPDPPLDCRPSVDGLRPPNADATHIARVTDFSGRGKFFSGNVGLNRADTVRIKPDLVAPGVRVFSTVPWDFAPYHDALFNNGCAKYWPLSPLSYHTYGSGTSFSAPVVSGAAALARQWFAAKGWSNPAPALLKAALIATADDLGGTAPYPTDHRPSPHYGWGRVSVDRLTDPAVGRFFRNENPTLAVNTGDVRVFDRAVQDGSRPTVIVLVWSDPPSAVAGNSQFPLVNDLELRVEGGRWRGNLFQENVTGVDNGYSFEFNPLQFPTMPPDSINNVEVVVIPPGTFSNAGDKLSLEVVGTNVTSGPQRFAIYAYNVL
jgi:hypothetical protein